MKVKEIQIKEKKKKDCHHYKSVPCPLKMLEVDYVDCSALVERG